MSHEDNATFQSGQSLRFGMFCNVFLFYQAHFSAGSAILRAFFAGKKNSMTGPTILKNMGHAIGFFFLKNVFLSLFVIKNEPPESVWSSGTFGNPNGLFWIPCCRRRPPLTARPPPPPPAAAAGGRRYIDKLPINRPWRLYW